jgi:hypothetical protein
VLFPNPARGTLYIRFSQPQTFTSIGLHDLSGRLVRSFTITTNEQLETDVDLTGIAPGVYMVTTGTHGQTRPSKLIIR